MPHVPAHAIPGRNDPMAPLAPGEALLVLDRALALMGCNPIAHELFGPTLKLREPLDLARLAEGPCLEELKAAFDEVLARGVAVERLEGGFRDPEGEAVECVYALTPLYDHNGQVSAVVLAVREEGSLLDGELAVGENGGPSLTPRGAGKLAENKADGIFTINRRWRIVSFNQAAERITGYRRDEVLGRHCWEIFRSELCDTGCPLCATLETGQTRIDQDVRILDRNGDRRASWSTPACSRTGPARWWGRWRPSAP